MFDFVKKFLIGCEIVWICGYKVETIFTLQTGYKVQYSFLRYHKVWLVKAAGMFDRSWVLVVS
jgi:hypothetical protein